MTPRKLIRDAFIAGFKNASGELQGYEFAPCEGVVQKYITQALSRPDDADWGELPPRPEPPRDGWRVAESTSTYYGSHEERGEGDVHYWIALPPGIDPAAAWLQHGSRSRTYKGPHEVLIWDGEDWLTPPEWER